MCVCVCVSVCVCLVICTNTEVPDAGTVVEGGVEFPDLTKVGDVPHIVTVITVHHRQLWVWSGVGVKGI